MRVSAVEENKLSELQSSR